MKNDKITYKDLNKALKTQQYRYLKRVKNMMEKDFYSCYFLTFTFSDETLQKTSKTTRERYIKEWLNQQASEYMLNIDYGDKNGREHYHAFILSRYKVIVINTPLRHNVFIKYKKISQTLYNYFGNVYIDRKPMTAENLTAHAFKETTKNNKIVYSRKNIKVDERFKALADEKLNAYRNSEQGKANKEQYNDLLKGDKKANIEHLNKAIELDNMIFLPADENDN